MRLGAYRWRIVTRFFVDGFGVGPITGLTRRCTTISYLTNVYICLYCRSVAALVRYPRCLSRTGKEHCSWDDMF